MRREFNLFSHFQWDSGKVLMWVQILSNFPEAHPGGKLSSHHYLIGRQTPPQLICDINLQIDTVLTQLAKTEDEHTTVQWVKYTQTKFSYCITKSPHWQPWLCAHASRLSTTFHSLFLVRAVPNFNWFAGIAVFNDRMILFTFSEWQNPMGFFRRTWLEVRNEAWMWYHKIKSLLTVRTQVITNI